MLDAASTIAAAVLDRDKLMPGLAIETVRAIVKRLPDDVAASLVAVKPKTPSPRPFDPARLIG